MAIRRFWIVDCDHREHVSNCGDAGEPEGEPAARFAGTMLRARVVERLIEQGWRIVGSKRVCPTCVAAERENEPCPDCKHAWRDHSGDPNYGGYFCHAWTIDDGCGCSKIRSPI